MEAKFIGGPVLQISPPRWQCLQNCNHRAEGISQLDPQFETGRQIAEQELEIKAGERETLRVSAVFSKSIYTSPYPLKI